MILSGARGLDGAVGQPLNPYVWIVLAVTLGLGFVGFYDDYLKVTKQTTADLPAASGSCWKRSSRLRRVMR